MIDRLTLTRVRRRGVSARAWDASLGRHGASNAVVLRTCERVETLTLLPPGAACRGEEPRAPTWRGEGALREWFRVGAGLDSRIVGESHVLGQVRRALDDARARGVDATLLGVVERSLCVARSVRTKTGIERIASSYAALAAERIERGARVGVIGTGALARDVAGALSGWRRVTIFGRDMDRAIRVAMSTGARAAPVASLAASLDAFDVVIAATSAPTPLLDAADVAQRARPLLAIDLGVPANIGAGLGARPGVTLLSLDDLDPGGPNCTRAIEHAERLVAESAARFAARLRERCAPRVEEIAA